MIAKAWAKTFSEVYRARTRKAVAAKLTGNKIVAKVDYSKNLTSARRAGNSPKDRYESYIEPRAKRMVT